MQIVLETPRLYLRPLQLDDVTQKYVDWLNDTDVNKYLETRHSVQTLDSCREFVLRCNADNKEHLMGIFLKESSCHIGNVKLGFVNSFHKRGQISLFIGEKAYWGKGLAKEVAYAMTKYGFEKVGLGRIEAGCYEENLASLRTFLSIGYTVEGFFRGHLISDQGKCSGCFWMGMLKHEFPKND